MKNHTTMVGSITIIGILSRSLYHDLDCQRGPSPESSGDSRDPTQSRALVPCLLSLAVSSKALRPGGPLEMWKLHHGSVRICMYAWMDGCMCVYIYVCVCAQTHTHTYIHMMIFWHILIYININMMILCPYLWKTCFCKLVPSKHIQTAQAAVRSALGQPELPGLVNIEKAVEHGWKWPIYRSFTHEKWWFSIVMLNNQRVSLGQANHFWFVKAHFWLNMDLKHHGVYGGSLK